MRALILAAIITAVVAPACGQQNNLKPLTPTPFPAQVAPAPAILETVPATKSVPDSPPVMSTSIPTLAPAEATEFIPEPALTGKYFNPNDAAEVLEVNEMVSDGGDAFFSWLSPGKGIERSGTWKRKGDKLSLSLRHVLKIKTMAGIEIIDPDGEIWEKYGSGSEPWGLYLRLDYEKLGDHLDLKESGLFSSEEGGVPYSGHWGLEGDQVGLLYPSDITIVMMIENGTIVGPEGVKWTRE